MRRGRIDPKKMKISQASTRLRMNLDLRNGPEDGSQRMLNAIEPGSPIAHGVIFS